MKPCKLVFVAELQVCWRGALRAASWFGQPSTDPKSMFWVLISGYCYGEANEQRDERAA
jgi:hypothetical protein